MNKNQPTKTVLCIPGKWAKRSEFLASIIDKNKDDFIFAGNILLNFKTNQGFDVQLCEPDTNMRQAFKLAGSVNQVSQNFLKEIEQHTMVAYLMADTGTPESAEAIAHAGSAILKAGGIGLKVESSGMAFEKDHWLSLTTNFEKVNLYEMYVLDSIGDEHGGVYSCGMHNLGLKDSIVYDEDFQEAVNLLSALGYYQLMENKSLAPGHTFGIAQDAPVFRLDEVSEQPNNGDDYFKNPYGMWFLERI